MEEAAKQTLQNINSTEPEKASILYVKYHKKEERC